MESIKSSALCLLAVGSAVVSYTPVAVASSDELLTGQVQVQPAPGVPRMHWQQTAPPEDAGIVIASPALVTNDTSSSPEPRFSPTKAVSTSDRLPVASGFHLAEAIPLAQGDAAAVTVDAANPDATNSDIAQLEAAGPEADSPDIAQLEAAGAEVDNPDIAQLEAASPEVDNPDIAQLEAASPEVDNPDIAQLEATAEVTPTEIIVAVEVEGSPLAAVDLPTLPSQVPPSTPEANPSTDNPAVSPTEDAPIEDAPIEDLKPANPLTPTVNPTINPDGQSEIDSILTETDLPPAELLADPNPLALPTTIEEVTIEDTRVVTLEEAIELSYFNNQDLQAAFLDLEQAQEALREAQAAYSPTVTTSADLTASEGNTTSISGLGTFGSSDVDATLNGAIQVDYDVFTSGQRAATVRASEFQVRLNELEVERRQEALRLTTANLYYDLQEATEQIRINQAFLDEASRNLRDNRIRQQEGVGTRFDVLRAEVQFANARQALIQSQSQQRIAQRDLSRLLNVPTTRNLQATPVSRAEDWPLTLEESILLAFQNRVELTQQLAQRDIAEQQAIAARAAIRPQVSVFANYSISDVLDNSSGDYSFGARLNWRFLDGGAANARARQQEIAATTAEERFSENVDQIRFDVEQAYFGLQANEENIDTAQVAVTQAQEALRLANLRLDAGVGTQLDVLTAQSELTQAEGNLVTALLGYNRALAALQRAISNLEATL